MGYPQSIDTFADPAPGDPRSDPSLSGLFDNLIRAVTEIETELGTVPKGAFGDVAEYLQDLLAGIVPAGAIFPYTGASVPSGFLLCNGQAVSRTTYADLFTAFGTRYGAGDGSTTFNLPDLRDRFPIGVRDMADPDTAPRNVGASGGTLSHGHGVSSTHSHSASGGVTSSDGDHTHRVDNNTQYSNRKGAGAVPTPTQPHGHGFVGSAGAHNHPVTVSSSGTSHEHVTDNPAYVASNYIVKV